MLTAKYGLRTFDLSEANDAEGIHANKQRLTRSAKLQSFARFRFALSAGKCEMELGDKLRALREVDGLTQEQAATKYGLSLSSYRKYEADSNEPGASALKGMADAGVDINALLAGHSVREPHTAYGAATPALRLNREALAAILEGLLKVMNDPKQIAEHLATVYEGAYNTGQITEGGIGSGDKADAA